MVSLHNSRVGINGSRESLHNPRLSITSYRVSLHNGRFSIIGSRVSLTPLGWALFALGWASPTPGWALMALGWASIAQGWGPRPSTWKHTTLLLARIVIVCTFFSMIQIQKGNCLWIWIQNTAFNMSLLRLTSSLYNQLLLVFVINTYFAVDSVSLFGRNYLAECLTGGGIWAPAYFCQNIAPLICSNKGTVAPARGWLKVVWYDRKLRSSKEFLKFLKCVFDFLYV